MRGCKAGGTGAFLVMVVFLAGSPTTANPPAAPVTIVIVDNGVDTSRPDLRRWADSTGRDFFDNDATAAPSVASGDPAHGTMMALVAMKGAAHSDLIKLLPLRVANERSVDSAAVADAIRFSGQRKDRAVVNLSLGTDCAQVPDAVSDAITRQTGLLFVVSAGNQGRRLDDTNAGLCRATAGNVVCVAAVDDADKLSVAPRASNYGPAVDVAAVGVDVDVEASDGARRVDTGTSLAAAYVSGVAAQIWSAAPSLTAREIAQVLCSSARKSRVLADSVRCGVVDAARSLRDAATMQAAREGATL